MSGGEWAAIIGAQACLVALVVLVVMIVRLDRAARDVRDTAVEFRAQAEPLLEELRAAVRSADYELDRIDAIVSGAERVTDRVDAASDLAYRTFTNPVVKAMAVGTGTKRAVQRLASGEPEPRRRSDARRTDKKKRRAS
ncbi:MAG: DUF948 domain-containing protein [Acidimicrobiia bacterium]